MDFHVALQDFSQLGPQDDEWFAARDDDAQHVGVSHVNVNLSNKDQNNVQQLLQDTQQDLDQSLIVQNLITGGGTASVSSRSPTSAAVGAPVNPAAGVPEKPATCTPATLYHRAPGKPPCRFGVSCTRKNPQHFIDEDHPDNHPLLTSAMSQLALPPPVSSPPVLGKYQRAPGKPRCRYGKSCTRKNPQHFIDEDHPIDHPLLAKNRK